MLDPAAGAENNRRGLPHGHRPGQEPAVRLPPGGQSPDSFPFAARCAQAGTVRLEKHMDRLATANGLVIRQKKEWGEILTGFEQRNKYVVSDPAAGDLYAALEEGGSTLARIFLRSIRPFRIQVVGLDRRPVLHLRRPFRWYFHELEVRDVQQRKLGTLRRRFSVVRRIYSVLDANGMEVYRLFGPLLHPWTFEIRQGEKVVGRIVKKWTGVAKEAFTDSDTFGLTFPAGCTLQSKAVLLGAVLLIDFVHFENSSG
jgi:uncharacterized protein YxjI